MASIDEWESELAYCQLILSIPSVSCATASFDFLVEQRIEELQFKINEYKDAILFMQYMTEEVEQNEPCEVVCEVNELESPVHEKFSELKIDFSLQACVGDSQVIPSYIPPAYYYIPPKNLFKPLSLHPELHRVDVLIYEIDTFMDGDKDKSFNVMLYGIRNKPFDPGGAELIVVLSSLFHQHFRLFPCDLKITLYPFVTWELVFKIWDPGG